MRTIGKLAVSRVRYNRSQTLLTGVAFVLTTCLLMAVSCMGYGLYHANKAMAMDTANNSHATFYELTPEQVETLRLHLDVEALTVTETYASVVKDKMNATLRCEEILLPGVRGFGLTAGAWPEAVGEIAGPPAFFKRLGYEAPAVGDLVDVPLRVLGEGEVVTETLVITGLIEQVDLSQYDVADTRIAYSARISRALADRDIPDEERVYYGAIRVKGEETLSHDQIDVLVRQVATDVGVADENININDGYLMWATDPGTEMIAVITGIALLIVLFATLVIYSIYYVAIITNVQELGKLKALGATKRQMKGLLLREGIFTAVLSIPVGLLLGYLVARGGVWVMKTWFWTEIGDVPLVYGPLLLAVVGVVLLTAVFSLLRPMRLVTKISPIEAIRYQEQSTGRQAGRKGYDTINVARLGSANMSRNRRRTTITIVTMALGGVLFLAAAGMLSSMDEMDYARNQLPRGEFIVEMRYTSNDETYTENNLNSMQQAGVLGTPLVEELLAIPGVNRVEPRQAVLATIHHPGYEEGKHYIVSAFSEEDIPGMTVRKGKVDYDAMTAANGMVFTYDISMEEKGFRLGDAVRLTLLDGDREVPFEGVLTASTHVGEGVFSMPEAVLARYITDVSPAESLYVWVDGGLEGESYAAVKAGLQELVDQNEYLALMSLDEEVGLARSAMQAMRIALYLILGILGVVSFMNLINTMITGVVTRRREIGTMQAIGLSNRQLASMLWQEGLVFTGGALLCALSIGNALGYAGFLWAKGNGLMAITHYHYPLAETLIMVGALVLGQFIVTRSLSRYAHKDSLVKRIQL